MHFFILSESPSLNMHIYVCTLPTVRTRSYRWFKLYIITYTNLCIASLVSYSCFKSKECVFFLPARRVATQNTHLRSYCCVHIVAYILCRQLLRPCLPRNMASVLIRHLLDCAARCFN